MTDNIIINANNVGILYYLQYEKYSTIKEQLINLFTPKKTYNEFWAIRNITFQARQGEFLGILGENGSGKSTLLKVLAKIFAPTEGSLYINGRVSALLELGTGFHPELTGEENLYLYGSILGLTKKDMKDRFDRILDFAEIGDFIYSPVKTYSSGMYMRLAFAVAMDVDPDILLIDEILAVGDISFQSKCMRKIQELRDKGVTIVLVTHDLSSIERLCEKAILLNRGNLVSVGKPSDVIDQYVNIVSSGKAKVGRDSAPKHTCVARISNHPQKSEFSTSDIELQNLVILDEQKQPTQNIFFGKPCAFRFEYKINRSIISPNFSLCFHDNDTNVIASYSLNDSQYNLPLIKSDGWLECWFDSFPLNPGKHYISIIISADKDKRKVLNKRMFYESDVISDRESVDIEPPADNFNCPKHIMWRVDFDPFAISLVANSPFASLGWESDFASLENGWYPPEKSEQGFRWTQKTATFPISNPNQNGKLILLIAASYLHKFKGAVRGTVFQDDLDIGRFALNNGALTECIFDLAYPSKNISNIKIILDRPFRLSEFEQSEDNRELGVAFFKVSLE